MRATCADRSITATRELHMNKTLLAAAVAATLGLPHALGAASLEDELAAIKARLNALEQQVREQNRVIADKDRELAALRSEVTQADGDGPGWFERIEIGGVIEVEASHSSPDAGSDSSDIITPTVELGITAQVTDWVAAELVLLYEEDTDNDDGSGGGSDFGVDTAMVTVADPDSRWFVNAGQFTLPFGRYETFMVADPLTLDLGETADTALAAGMGFGVLSASVYVFDGDRGSRVNNYGAALGLVHEFDGVSLSAHLGYIDDINESDGLQDVMDGAGLSNGSQNPAGWAASVGLDFGPVSVIAEYVAALDGFDGAAGAEPSAFNLEAGYGFELAGRPALVAIAWQGTDDYAAIDTAVSEKRLAAAVSVEIFDGTLVALEYRADEDYTGADTDTVSALLAVEF
jgi:hypothetical protein